MYIFETYRWIRKSSVNINLRNIIGRPLITPGGYDIPYPSRRPTDHTGGVRVALVGAPPHHES